MLSIPQTPKLKNTLENIRRSLNCNMYIKELFDPIQTHGVYNVDPFYIDTIKSMLKDNGAKRFRIVKNKTGAVIICFKLDVH